MPSGVGWLHVFGGLLLFFLGLQALTGMLLGLYYSPSVEDAHASIEYLEREVTAGAFIRGLHHWGSSAVVVLAAIHLAQVFLWSAYKRPRQLLWVVGVLLFAVILGFGFTGYLLPWDLKAYFGTQVGISIAGSVPVVGESIERLVQGGEDVGPLTLTRFYSLHVSVLPILLILLAALHLFLVRYRGITPPWKRVGEDGELTQRFWPDQAFRDLVATIFVLAIVAALAQWVGAPLEEPADPNDTSYVPRPEWYFFAPYQLLKWLDGPLKVFGTTIIPGVAFLLLIALPFYDRNPERLLRKRPIALVSGLFAAISVITLTLIPMLEGVPEIEPEEEAAAVAEDSKDAPAGEETKSPTEEPDSGRGVSDQAPFELSEAARRGKELYRILDCGSCHEKESAGRGVNVPPTLARIGDRVQSSWLKRYLDEPWRVRYVEEDERPVERMPDYDLEESELDDLVAYLETMRDLENIPPGIAGEVADPTPEQIEAGRTVYEDYFCYSCHILEGDGVGFGPNLDGVGNRLKADFLFKFLKNPLVLIPDSPMQVEVDDEDARALVRFLMSQKTK